MLVTKEQKYALLQEYIKRGKNQDECSGFIDGMYALYRLMSESKIEELNKEIKELNKP